MRTTLAIDDVTMKALKDAAHGSGKTFKQVVNETLRAGLQAKQSTKGKPYRMKPARLGRVLPGVDLDKSLQLADRLEDEEIARELQMKK